MWPFNDPTANVNALVAANALHEREMRELQHQFTSAEIKHAEEIGRIRSEHAKELTARSDIALKALADVTTATAATQSLTLANTERSLATKTASDMSILTDRIVTMEKQGVGGAAGAEALAKAKQRSMAVIMAIIGIAAILSSGMLATAAIVITIILKFVR